jgi:hypothetical protein
MSGQKTLKWMDEVKPYMSDSETPKWKLDVMPDFESCYYDEKGAAEKKEESTSMYDCPEIPMDDERAIFCTFVMTNNQITHMVAWSKQYVNHEGNDIECYCFLTNEWNKPLPFWAIEILQEFYVFKGKNLPEEIVSKEAINELSKTPKEFILEEVKDFFLKPPENWVTILKFPDLFLKKILAEKKEIQKEEKKIDFSSELEKMTLFEDKSIVSKEKESKPLITQFEKTILKKEEEDLLQEENEQIEDLGSKGTTKLFKN